MKVIIRAREDLLQAPIADIAAIQRMERAWRLPGVTQVFSPDNRIPEEISLGDSVLWCEGIFPFMSGELVVFLMSAGEKSERCVRLLAPGNGNMGLAFFPSWAKEMEHFCFGDEGFWDGIEYAEGEWDPLELQALDSAESFAILNECGFQMTRDRAMQAGALLMHPETTWIGEAVRLDAGVILHPQVTLRGKTHIAAGSVIHSGSVISDSELAEGVCVKPYSVIEQSRLGPGAQVGPFAHLRPQTVAGAHVRIGNFVETKKATLGDGTKASHLSYIGDATLGRDCNVGAGTITCNYDGFNKNRTRMGDRVFIGSDCQLIAPINLGDDVYVAAGSTITNDVASGDLAIARVRQQNKKGFAEKIRTRARHMSEKKPRSE